jgi:hypothetical protein
MAQPNDTPLEREVVVSNIARQMAEEYLQSVQQANGELPENFEVPKNIATSSRDVAILNRKITPEEGDKFCEIFDNHCASARKNINF